MKKISICAALVLLVTLQAGHIAFANFEAHHKKKAAPQSCFCCVVQQNDEIANANNFQFFPAIDVPQNAAVNADKYDFAQFSSQKNQDNTQKNEWLTKIVQIK